jgi:hypothetical protein
MGSRRPSRRLLPAFDDDALIAAQRHDRGIWDRESAALRDRLMALPADQRLTAIDNDATRAELMPPHRATILASLAPPQRAAPPTADQQQTERAAAERQRREDYARELAAWRRRDAAQRAEAQRATRLQRLTAWCYAPAAAALPSVALAAWSGWTPLQVAAATLDALLPPGLVVGLVAVCVGAVCVAAAGACCWWARRAHPADLWFVAGLALVAGLLLAASANSLPYVVIRGALLTTDHRPLSGTLARLDGWQIAIVAGNGAVSRGERFTFNRDPTPYFGKS